MDIKDITCRICFFTSALAVLLLCAGYTSAYPLNAFEQTGIKRLEGFFYSLRTKSGKENFPPGSLLSIEEVKLSLAGQTWNLPPNDENLKAQLLAPLGRDANHYSFAVLDFSDPESPRYAAHNESSHFIPGSVGKLIVAAAFLQSLADLYPDEPEKRAKLLRDTVVRAGEIVQSDSHEVPFWHYDEGRIEYRPLRADDSGNLYTFLDWMISSSSNAAGSAVMRELVLLNHFKKTYPRTPQESQAFLKRTSPAALAAILQSSVKKTLERNGLDTSNLFHVSPFTAAGKRLMPARGSTATAKELVRLLLLMEQGRLIDRYSSLELKRLLYLTQQRIRYASSPALDFSAVYYKSGSLYRCRSETGFSCGKYRGNLLNLMNSVALIESPYVNPRARYIAAINSNVLRKDSAAQHAGFAAEVEKVMMRNKKGGATSAGNDKSVHLHDEILKKP
ncbi:MAG: serine hydrolase [Deltaproteobacteria bacterium]|nr:serine hydrolase [Deltaproteobacteria bacterium]